MQHSERTHGYEALAASLEKIAYAYGFSTPPLVITKKQLSAQAQGKGADQHAAVSLALLSQTTPTQTPVHLWGVFHGAKRTSTVSFAIIAARHPLGNALVLKATHALAERAGLKNATVLVSSIGDAESQRRFARELAAFFRKQIQALPEEMRNIVLDDPGLGYRHLLAVRDPLLERAPKPIDYLSENSRKTMLDALALFEAVGLPYALEPHLPSLPDTHAELLFAIEGTDAKGIAVRIASGGRFDHFVKKENTGESAVSMSIELSEELEMQEPPHIPSCYVVHVGDAAKLRAFATLETLWKTNLYVGETLLADTLREQMERAKASKTKYILIIGQREALDGTVIVRNTATQLQTVIPLDRLPAYVSRR